MLSKLYEFYHHHLKYVFYRVLSMRKNLWLLKHIYKFSTKDYFYTYDIVYEAAVHQLLAYRNQDNFATPESLCDFITAFNYHRECASFIFHNNSIYLYEIDESLKDAMNIWNEHSSSWWLI